MVCAGVRRSDGPGVSMIAFRPTPSGSDALLEVRGLGCYFLGRPLWRGLDLTLHAGERLAINAPSGTGKTVLLRMLAGLINASEGEIYFENRLLQDWSMPAYRAQVMLLAQQPALPLGRVEAILAAAFAYRTHRHRTFCKNQVLEYLQPLGRNEDFLAQHTDYLSGGEAQLIALIRCLLLEPRVLLLDEPTASLDSASTGQIEKLLDAWLRANPGRAWIWTSHDHSQRGRIADRVIELSGAA